MSIENVMRKLLGVLNDEGAVVLTANVGGSKVSLSIDSNRAAQRPPAKAGKRQATAASAVDTENVLELLSKSEKGLSLEELATALSIRPRNLLKPVLARLKKGKQVIKAGRLFRPAGMVVRRGPKAKGEVVKSADYMFKDVKKSGPSPSKLAALQKARDALAASRAKAKRAAARAK